MDLITSSSTADDSFRFHISDRGFDHKPTNYETSKVIVSMSTSDYYSLDTAVDALAEGHSIIPAQLSNYGEKGFGVKADYYTSQQLFLFDIDSRTDIKTGKVKLTVPQPEDTIQRLIDLGLVPAFWYPTFSHLDKIPKYRIGFVCDRKITSKFERRVIIGCFSEIIGKEKSNQYYVDKQTFNENRMFFGTNKGVWVLDKTTRFSTEQLLQATAEFLTAKGRKNNHSRRNLELFAHKFELIYDEEKGLYLPDYANATNSNINNYYANGGAGKRRKTSDLNIPIKKLVDVCIAGQKLDAGEDVPHDDRIRFMSNVTKVRGGKKWYIDTIYQKHYIQFGIGTTPEYEIENWEKNGNSIWGCGECTFRKLCTATGSNVINSIVRLKGAKIRRVEEYKPISVELVRGTDSTLGRLEYYLENMITPDEINVIRADCGIGKTRIVQQMKNVIIAEKTNKCCMQVVEDRKKVGLDTISFPDLKPFWTEDIKMLYQIGAIKEANIEIRKLAKKYMKNPPSMRTEKEQAYIDYVEAYKRLKDEDTTTVMTIDRLLNLDNSFNRNVIFDEHPLFKLVDVENIKYEDVECFKQLCTKLSIPAVSKIIEAINNRKQMPKISMKERRKLADQLYKLPRFDMKLFKLISADKIAYSDKGITCYKYRKLPKGTITILSGTIESDVLELAIGSRKYNYEDMGKVQLKGKIIQHVGDTWSRKFIDENLEKLQELVEQYEGCNIITYKKFMELADADINFGAVEGLNELQGNDLLVIGSAYLNPQFYIDIAIAWGHIVPIDAKMRNQKVEYRGFEFYCTTFDDKILRTIHLFSIFDELIQAVYRARPIDNECTIHIYSNLPLLEAEIRTN